MEYWKKVGKALLFPHSVFMILLVPTAMSLLIYSFLYTNEINFIRIVSYAFSFYTLTVLCFRIPDFVRFVKRLRNENRHIVRYRNDAHLRVKISLYGSFVFNTAYAMFQLCLGFYHASVWFYAMAGYYILLAVMRFFLLRHTRAYKPAENMEHELYRYRFCGVCLLMMNIILSVIIFYIVWQNRTFRHNKITTIAMATYTFAALTLAIVNLIKYRKYESPVFSATKAISLASACVSMLTLETAMLTVFGESREEGFRQMMTGMTGAAVSVSILTMAVIMIVNSTKKLKALHVNNF